MLPKHVIAYIEYLTTKTENSGRCCLIWGSDSNGVGKTCFSGMLPCVTPLSHLSIEEAVEKGNEESLEWGQKMCRVRPEGKFPYSPF